VSELRANGSGRAASLRVSLAVLLALWVMLGGSVVAASATTDTEDAESEQSEQPLLSITVESSAGEVESGDEVTYTAVLENLGASAVDVVVVLSAPEYVALSDDPVEGATVEGAEASWDSTLEAAGSAEFEIDAVIGTIPDTERRVTTLVSVFVGDPAELIVRTADAARIVGVEDGPNEVAEEAAQEASTADERLWLTVGLIAAAVVFGVLLIVTIVVVARSRTTTRQK